MPGALGRLLPMTYAEAIDFLYQLRLFGTKLGLDNTRRLAEAVGHPQKRLKFIHVAGTNGKGSVCALLESVYRRAGLKVGLYTSPHLVTFGERIQINRQALSQDDMARVTTDMAQALKRLTRDQDAHPTFFEVVTVMAMTWFAEQGCDLVLWETGMGGRLDATNIVTPQASVITNVGLDHGPWLGHTLEAVAREKAGIIKPGIPVLTAAQEPALAIIAHKAKEQGAPLTVLTEDQRQSFAQSGPALSLAGAFQSENAALAAATVQVLQGEFPVAANVLREGLSSATWPGRLQEVSLPEGRTLLLDGAHNLEGMNLLCQEKESSWEQCHPVLILGVLDGKPWEAMCRRIAPSMASICTVPVPGMNSVSPETLASACRQSHPEATVQACSGWEEAWSALEGSRDVVVTGSLYLVGLAMDKLGLSACEGSYQPDLNEAGFA